jgi:hypothetical protein
MKEIYARLNAELPQMMIEVFISDQAALLTA